MCVCVCTYTHTTEYYSHLQDLRLSANWRFGARHCLITSPAQARTHTCTDTHTRTHTHTCILTHMCTLNNLVASVCAQALTHSRTWWSTLHINKDKSRNGQRMAPRGTKLLLGDHSRVPVCVCVCVCSHMCVYAGLVAEQNYVRHHHLPASQHKPLLSAWRETATGSARCWTPRWLPVKVFATSRHCVETQKWSDNIITASHWTRCQSALTVWQWLCQLAVSHVKHWITPLLSSAACLGMGCAVSTLIPDKNPAHWGDTVQSVFSLCQADKPNYRGKIPGISPRSSLLSTVSCTPSVPQERNSIDFPDSQIWTQNSKLCNYSLNFP